jgi:hypothetical protein
MSASRVSYQIVVWSAVVWVAICVARALRFLRCFSSVKVLTGSVVGSLWSRSGLDRDDPFPVSGPGRFLMCRTRGMFRFHVASAQHSKQFNWATRNWPLPMGVCRTESDRGKAWRRRPNIGTGQKSASNEHGHRPMQTCVCHTSRWLSFGLSAQLRLSLCRI